MSTTLTTTSVKRRLAHAFADGNAPDRRSSKRSKNDLTTITTNLESNPLGLLPLGNALVSPHGSRSRDEGLGMLGALSDELLLSVFAALDVESLFRVQGVSRAFFAWSRLEGMWKDAYIRRSKGRLLSWHDSWRSSYVMTFLAPPDTTSVPTAGIKAPQLFSDVLFQPHLCASFSPERTFKSSSFVPTIDKIDGRSLKASVDLPRRPVILQNLMGDWPSLKSPSSEKRWTIDSLSTRFPTSLFRAESVLTTISSYSTYHDSCAQDESPLYLFSSDFVEKTRSGADEGMGCDFRVPDIFNEDLLKVMGERRPDYRWLIIGPARSGSTFHQDPNGTSAWNAVVTGAKAWIAFPPDVTPPGVHVSEDMGEVEAPLSIAEWMINYYPQAKATYGVNAKDPNTRGKMLEGICETGEIFFVPSGWWHLVVNLSSSIAVTQNFVSRPELPNVLDFFKNRSDQVSGFKFPSTSASEDHLEIDEDGCEGSSDVYEAFCEALRREYPDVLEGELEGLRGIEEGRERAMREVGESGRSNKTASMWVQLKGAGEGSGDGPESAGRDAGGFTGFSFGFDLDEADADG